MDGSALGPGFSETGHTIVHTAWQSYVSGSSLDVQHLRSEVASSWQRCNNLRIDPRIEADGSLIVPSLLRERRFQNQRLLRNARPAMEGLYRFVKGTGFQVVLTDETGFLLDVLGDDEVLRKSRRVDLCPGGDWSERSKGTNAIGTAIFERKPIQILAAEHFCAPNHFLACSAAPIFDPDGQMVGVLDLSGDFQYANVHTLGMVVASANAIENQLRLQRATQKLYIEHRYSNTVLDHMSEGIVSVDEQGHILEVNSKGAEIFGVDPKLVKGQHISRVLNSETPLLTLLSGGDAYEDRDIFLHKIGKKMRSSASLVRDDSGAVLGAVAVFRDLESRPAPPRRRALPSRCYSFEDIIGQDAATISLKQWAQKAAASSCTVLVTGESGTGKELFSQAIHNASAREHAPFIAINCAAMPDNLIESELFGFEDGSFTGARKGGQAGKFEMADGGTLFLDEIGEMPLNVQTKLLRVLQEKKITRIGRAAERYIDVRIIAATNKDLAAEVQAGRFREDLYYRLAVLEVRVPALRERLSDIPMLVDHFVEKISCDLGISPNPTEESFVRKLQTHSWPGNIRELENVIQRAIVRAGEGTTLSEDFVEVRAPRHNAPDGVQKEGAPIRSLREVEEEEIRRALRSCTGNIQRTASLLGICRNTLYRKMKEYGVEL